SQNDCIGKTLKPWPILVDHYNLSSVDGKSIDNFDITMNSLEAGESSYNERRGGYASIKN
ncbi:hypothetical protein FXE75_04585, partial [Vibrio cholerae]